MGTSSSWQQLPPPCKSFLLCIPTFFLLCTSTSQYARHYSTILIHYSLLTKKSLPYYSYWNVHAIYITYKELVVHLYHYNHAQGVVPKMFHSIPQHSTALHSITQSWKIFYSILLHSTAFYSILQHSTTMHMHSTWPCIPLQVWIILLKYTIQLTGHMRASWSHA